MGKTNIDTLFSNLSKHSHNNENKNGLQIIEEKSENSINNEDSSNNDSNKNSFILLKKKINNPIENNFLKQKTFNPLSKNKDTAQLLYRGKTASSPNNANKISKINNKEINNIEKKTNQLKTIISNMCDSNITQQNNIKRIPKRNSLLNFPFEKQKSNFLNNQQLSKRKSIISNINSVYERNKSIISDVTILNNTFSKNLFIPKTQLKVIKVPWFL